MAIKGIPLKKADDLFDKSSMSFGSHLEELRKCLFLAIAWLAAGMAIGLLFATDIVTYVQRPLQKSLTEFYVRRSEQLIELKGGGALDEDTKNLMRANNLTAELIYIAPAELARLQPADPAAKDALKQGDSTGGAAEGDAAQRDAAEGDASENTAAEGDAAEDDAAEGDAAEGDAADGDAAENPAAGNTAAEGESSESEPKTLTEQVEAAEGTPPAGVGIDRTPMPNDPEEEPKVDPVAGERAIERAGLKGDPLTASLIEKFRTPTLDELQPYWQFEKLPANTDALSMQEPFMIWLKAGFVAGLVIASPGIFYSLWKFVAAGLYPHERKYVYTLLPFAVLLFVSGVCLAFFFIFELVIAFLLTFNESLGISASPRLTDYMSFALFLPLGFGVAFQLPLVMLALERIGLISVQTYIAQWRLAVLVIFFVAMILTPAEVTSMLGMAIPLVLLYYVGIALCIYFPRRGFEPEVGYDPA